MPSSFTQSALAGAQITGQAFERRLRAQEQRSREAQRILQERLLAQQIEDLERKEAESQAQQEALRQAAQRWQQEMASEQSFEQLPEGVQGPPKPMPKLSPGEAFLQHYLPTARTPEQARQIYEAATKFEAENDPNSFINQIKLNQLKARQDELLVEKDRLTLSELNTLLRRSGQSLQATKTESELAKEGQKPKFQIQPPDIAGALPSISEGTSTAPTGPVPFVPTLEEAPRRLTPGTVTEHQRKLTADEIALGTIGGVLQAAESMPEAFGPEGAARELAEKAQSVATRGRSKMPITEARQKARLNFSTIADSIQVDSGNMNQKELELLRDVGDATRVFDTPGDVKVKMSQLRDLKLKTLAKRYQALNQPVPESVVKSMDDITLARAVLFGLLSEDRAETEYKRRHE